MKKGIAVATRLTMLVMALSVLSITMASQVSATTVSGDVIGGYRVLNLTEYQTPLHLVVYRGDYVKFIINEEADLKVVKIPELEIETHLSNDTETAPYFKMKKTGRYKLVVGGVTGMLDVVDYVQSNYRELTAKEGLEFIKNGNPLILDVRTPKEFQMGRLENAKLIPVQVLQQRLSELEAFKNKDILIYCATGNRSTVASKILNDQGFTKVSNLRRGIVNWYKEGLPIIK